MVDPAPTVSPDVSAAAYRIVQESLSNVIRHAAGAETSVKISVGAGDLMQAGPAGDGGFRVEARLPAVRPTDGEWRWIAV